MSSSKLSKNHHYGCIGREEEHRKMIEFWQKGNKRVFNCHGGKETGKSCFIRKFLDDLIQNEASYSMVIDMDFKDERIGPKDSVKFWSNLAKKLERLKLVNQISHHMMEESLENFFEEIKERKIIFLLDNLDYARNAKADDKSKDTEKDLFSELQDKFIPGIVERTDLSMVFITSTVQLRYGQIAPTVHKIEMDPLSTESAGELLLKTIELTSDMDNKAAREHLGPYLEPIARLSEGIPIAVIVTGRQLTENNFFIKPKELLTVLIFSRMYTLCPEVFPKEDIMIQTYGDYIEKQSSGMKERLQEMDGKAIFKTQTVTPLLRSFVKNVGNPYKSETQEMPKFLREFVIIEKIIESSKGLDVEDRLACRKVASDCLHLLGKDLDVDELRRIIANPNEYDEFVEQTITTPTPEEDRFMDTQKDMGKNDLGKPFLGYLPESLLGCTQESNLSDLPEQRIQNLKLLEKVEDKGVLNERKKSKTAKGGDGTSASTAIQVAKYIVEEIEREFLLRGVTENGQGTNGMGTKNDKFDNSLNLSSSYGEKQYPHNKMALSVMENNTGPKEAENGVGFSPASSTELTYVRDQCMKQTDGKGAQGNSLHETDVNTKKKRMYMEHKVNRTNKDDEGYVSPHISDSDERASPDPWGLDVEDRLACRKVASDCLHLLGKDLDVDELRRIIENTNEYDEFVEQTITTPTPEEDRFMNTQKDMGKNDLGKPFIGYSPESISGCRQESDLSDLPKQRMQNLKLSEKDTDQDSHSSLSPGTPNEEIQGEQTQDYLVPGQLAEQFSRFNYSVSNMPPSMERSPQSIAHARFIYRENDIFQCQYCQAQIHESDLSGNVNIMQRHQEINQRCPFVRQYQEYRGQNSRQKDTDQDSDSSLSPGTPNEEIQGEQTQDYILLGQLAEQFSRFNYNVSNMPPSMERSPQSVAHVGFLYKGKMSDFKRVNFYRLSLLIIDVGTRVLKWLFEKQYTASGDLEIFLKSRASILDSLHKKKIIERKQMDLLRPSTGIKPSVENFDASLLITLLTKICPIQQPHDGWTVSPAASDLSTGADILRLREARNNLFHHDKFGISDAEFQVKSTFVSAAISRLSNQLDWQQQVNIQKIINDARQAETDSGREKEIYNLIFRDKIDEIHHLIQGTYDRGRDGAIAGLAVSEASHSLLKDKKHDGTKHQPDIDMRAQSVIERQQDFKTDVYTLPWSCYPRVEVLMQQHNSISKRCIKLMDCYNTCRQNLTQQSQFLPTRVCIVNMKRNPQILVIGDLRGEVTIRNIACSTDQLKDDLPFKTTTLRNWTQYYHCPEDPVVVVFTVRIVTEDDFLRCLNNLNHILGHPYHIMCVIEMGHHINRQSLQYLHFNNVVARYTEQSWNQEAKMHNFSVILDDQQVKEKVSGKISECFELEVVTSLILIEDSLKKNIRDEDFISHLKFSQAGFVKNIKDAVTSLLTCDYRVADAVQDRFQNEVGNMTLQALKDIITEVYLQAVRKGMVNELSCFIGIMPEIIERLVDQADFEPLCKASIQNSTIKYLVESFLPAMTGYSCEHLRNQEERKRLWKLFEQRDHSEYIDILIDDLKIVIEDTARKITLKELEKILTIQKKLHFEVVSLLKRTVSKDRFEHLLPAGELPSDDLFGIEEVEGFGIMYNKLHIHIKLKNPEDEGKIFEQIKAKLFNYHYPYRLVVIADNKASVCVGDRLYNLYQNREKDLAY